MSFWRRRDGNGEGGTRSLDALGATNAEKIALPRKARKVFPVRLMEYQRLREWECFDADSRKDFAVELRGMRKPKRRQQPSVQRN